jgi:hypothetical protein
MPNLSSAAERWTPSQKSEYEYEYEYDSRAPLAARGDGSCFLLINILAVRDGLASSQRGRHCGGAPQQGLRHRAHGLRASLGCVCWGGGRRQATSCP